MLISPTLMRCDTILKVWRVPTHSETISTVWPVIFTDQTLPTSNPAKYVTQLMPRQRYTKYYGSCTLQRRDPQTKMVCTKDDLIMLEPIVDQ